MKLKIIWPKIPYKSLLAILIMGAFIFYILSFLLDKTSFLHEALLHLASICIELLVATYLVDKIVTGYKENEKKRKWKNAKDVAYEDLKDLSLSLAYTILLPLNIYIPVEPNEITEEQEIKQVLTLIDKFNKSDSKKLILNITSYSKTRLKENLTILKAEFETTILTYKDILPADLLKQLWQTRINFNRFYKSYSQDIDFVFNGTNKNPLTTEEEERQKIIKAGFLSIISQDLNNYMSEVENLINLVTKVNS